MSSLNLHEIKAELKVHGCKLKTQLDGTWAIHEPRGKRVIVPNLEAVEEYCRAKSGENGVSQVSDPKQHQSQQSYTHEHSRSYAAVEISSAEPVNTPEVVKAEPVPVVNVKPVFQNIPEPVSDSARISPITEQAKPAVQQVQQPKVENAPTLSPTAAVPMQEKVLSPAPLAAPVGQIVEDVESGVEDNSALRLSNLRVELKKMGCKLKSQQDGSWCIDESKGRRTIVSNLNAVQAYIDAKNGKPAATSETGQSAKPAVSTEPETKATRPLTAAALAEMAAPVKPVEQAVAAPVKPALSPEQMESLAIVNQMLRDIKTTRLPQGLNFLHSEILPYLQDNNCPAAYLEKALSYAEAKLQKDCIDKVLVKRAFKNHRNQPDIMYFEARYAPVLSV